MPTQSLNVAHTKRIELLEDKIEDLLLEIHELNIDFDALEQENLDLKDILKNYMGE
tara:strand:+ start:829 stop:996 length:168 start_codon:yes stop_codon:yes gene_type:complete